MGAHSFRDLTTHVGHRVVCVSYAGENTALECQTCGEVLIDYNRDDDDYEMTTWEEAIATAWRKLCARLRSPSTMALRGQMPASFLLSEWKNLVYLVVSSLVAEMTLPELAQMLEDTDLDQVTAPPDDWETRYLSPRSYLVRIISAELQTMLLNRLLDDFWYNQI